MLEPQLIKSIDAPTCTCHVYPLLAPGGCWPSPRDSSFCSTWLPRQLGSWVRKPQITLRLKHWKAVLRGKMGRGKKGVEQAPAQSGVPGYRALGLESLDVNPNRCPQRLLRLLLSFLISHLHNGDNDFNASHLPPQGFGTAHGAKNTAAPAGSPSRLPSSPVVSSPGGL